MRDYRLICAFLTAAFALPGCDISVSERPLEVDVPDAFSNARSANTKEAHSYAWWSEFRDPVLNRVISIALSGSPSIDIAKARLREAEAEARGSKNWPTGGANIETRVTEGSRAEAGELEIDWSFFGGRRQQAEAAIARLEAAKHEADSAYQQLVAELATAYVNLRFQQQRHALSLQDLHSRQDTLKTLNDLATYGNATRLDVIRAEALVVETRAALSVFSGEIVREKNRIATLSGRPLSALGLDLSFKGPQPIPEGTLSTGVPAEVLRKRPEVRRAEALYSASLRDLEGAKAARYPSLTLSGDILVPFSGTGAVETAIAGIALPIFQQSALAAQEDAAAARVNAAYAEWTLEVLSAVEEVETALAAIRGSAEASDYARQLVNLNTEALEIARKLLQAGGRSTVLELLESERDVTSSRLILAESRRDYALNAISLYRALGVDVMLQRGHAVAN